MLRRPEEKRGGGFSTPCSYGDFWGPYPQSLLLRPAGGLLPGADFIETLPGASWPDGPGLSANRERAVILGRLRKPQGDFRGHPEPPIPGHDLQQRGPVPRVRPCQKVDERIPVSVPKPRGQVLGKAAPGIHRRDQLRRCGLIACPVLLAGLPLCLLDGYRFPQPLFCFCHPTLPSPARLLWIP